MSQIGRGRGRGRGRGQSIGAAAGSDQISDASASAAPAAAAAAAASHIRGANWTNEEIKRMLQALLDYAEHHGLPSSTKVSGQERSNADDVVPVGWSVISNAMHQADPAQNKPPPREPIQVMRKFDNLKTEAKELFKWLATQWDNILRDLATRTYIDDSEQGYRHYRSVYRIATSYPFGFEYQSEDETDLEPEADMIDAVKTIIHAHHTDRIAIKYSFIVEEVIWYFDEINTKAALHLPELPSSRGSRQRRGRREEFQLSDTERRMMVDEMTSPASSNSSSSTSDERRRRRPRPDDAMVEAILKSAEATEKLADALKRLVEHKEN